METPHKSRRTTKLTGDRAARKREQDRQAQRSAREKTKKLIAHLESRIETLTRFHNSGNVQELINELETQRKANEALRTTLRSIERAINTGLSEASSSSRSQDSAHTNFSSHLDTVLKNSSPPKKEINNNRSTSPDGQNSEHPAANGGIPEISQQPSLVGPSQHHIPQQSVSPPFDEPAIIDKFSPNGTFGGLHDGLSLAAKTPDDVHVPFNSTLHSFPLDIPMPIQALVQSTESPCDCCKQLLYMNEMLGRFALSSIQNMADQRVRDADIAIRAVLHGWDAVSHLYQLDPIWAMLRTADEGVWRACGAVERLSILRIVSLMLRYLSDPSESNLRHLPKFMRQRPSQHRIIHKPLIDFVVWPGLRERLILFPHQHCSEKFWSMFWTCFRISWPYHLHDTFTQQGPTSLYRFSDTFNKYFFDLESWCMTPEFFREYPDLEADVNMVPNSAGSTPCAVDGELAMGNSGLGHGGVSRLNPIAANIFTPFPITDWSTSRNHFF